MNVLELRLIVDNIKRYGGFREKDIIKNLVKVELIQNDEKYKVYKFYNKNNEFFEYEFRTHRVIG